MQLVNIWHRFVAGSCSSFSFSFSTSLSPRKPASPSSTLTGPSLLVLPTVSMAAVTTSSLSPPADAALSNELQRQVAHVMKECKSVANILPAYSTLYKQFVIEHGLLLFDRIKHHVGEPVERCLKDRVDTMQDTHIQSHINGLSVIDGQAKPTAESDR